ncbi:MAG: stage V sporulation protein AD [Clostridia bacterium]|nr:stage V sporulation protein AD [Clostridia bacterium]
MNNGVIKFLQEPKIMSTYSCVGSEEKKGPLGMLFNYYSEDNKFGKETWEKSESEMQRIALFGAMQNAGIKDTGLDILLAGDLLNQCVGSSFGLSDYDIPYVGLYGACSTCALGLALGACLISGGMAERVGTVTSSHFCSSERQFRFPLEYGGQRPPTAQWTVTGAGAFILGNQGRVSIPEAVFGKIKDMGIKDVNNMGAAMAPSCVETIKTYFRETDHSPEDFDMIITGDLGYEGSEILKELLLSEGIDIRENHTDCGLLIYDMEAQDKHAGGSGCGCSASVISAHILKRLEACELQDVLFIGTGALMNSLTVCQGNSIPAISHLVRLKTEV